MKKRSKVIREFGKIWKREDFAEAELQENPDQIFLSTGDFIHLIAFIEENRHTEINKAFQIARQKGKSFIQVKNYVGIIETKEGVTVEILPKVYTASDTLEKQQQLFLRMLRQLRNSPFISIKNAHLKISPFPILEVFISGFLNELKKLQKTGLKKDYRTQSSNQRFLRGKLLFHKQLKNNLTKPHLLYAEHDNHLLDTPANRLLKTCLKLLLKKSKSIRNQNQIRHQLLYFDSVSISENILADLQRIDHENRLYRHYQQCLRWTRIFLMGQSFTNFKGRHLNQALLFPMERIFEDYVGVHIKKQLLDFDVKLQDKRFHLINEHLGKPKFRLRPDIVIRSADKLLIIDTKWKNIDQNRPKANYEIRQSDMYQLFAYGEKYRQTGLSPTLVLLYPKQPNLTRPLPLFKYHPDHLPLYIIPVDLERPGAEIVLIRHLLRQCES